MSALANGGEIDLFKIDQVRITNELIILHCKNGVDFPIRLSSGRASNINTLSESERKNWRLTENEFGVYWPSIERQPKFANSAMLDSLDLAWEKITERALDNLSKNKWNFEALSADEKDIVALWRLEADIYNGGFMQFFCNWGDANCQIAISSLGKIGAVYTHKIVTRMRELLNRMENHPEVRELTDIYVVMNANERTEMQTLDERFWEDPDEMVIKMVGYFSNYFYKAN